MGEKNIFRRGMVFEDSPYRNYIFEQNEKNDYLPAFKMGSRIIWWYPNTGKMKVEAIK